MGLLRSIQNPEALQVTTGELRGEVIALLDDLLIGRGTECAVSIPDQKLSRRHARVFRRRKKWVIEDLDSNNGTYLNGRRIRRGVLQVDDHLRLGRTELYVVGPAPDTGEVPVPPANWPRTAPSADEAVTLTDEVPRNLRALPTARFLAALGSPEVDDQLVESTEQRQLRLEARNFAAVYNVAHGFQQALHLPDLLNSAADRIFESIETDRCTILLADPDSGRLTPKLTRRRQSDGDTGNDTVKLSRTILDRVMSEKSAIVSTDARKDARFADARSSIIDLSLRSLLCAPIIASDNVIGAIQLDRHLRPAPFELEDFELVTVISVLLGAQIENVRLFEAQERTIDELRATRAELVRKERTAALGRVTSGLAHEISNLMVPFSMAPVLAIQYPDLEDIQEITGLMRQSHQQITALLREVKLLTQGESARLTLGEHDLRRTIDGVIRFVRCDPDIDRHRILVDAPRTLRWRYDDGAIRQVLINLLRNAAQAMSSRGVLHVKARYERRLDTLTVEVIDEGPGIPERVAKRIFEPFFSTKGSDGMGLGLDLSRRIVERHGGRLTCDSEPGRGTVMRIELTGAP